MVPRWHFGKFWKKDRGRNMDKGKKVGSLWCLLGNASSLGRENREVTLGTTTGEELGSSTCSTKVTFHRIGWKS